MFAAVKGDAALVPPIGAIPHSAPGGSAGQGPLAYCAGVITTGQPGLTAACATTSGTSRRSAELIDR